MSQELSQGERVSGTNLRRSTKASNARQFQNFDVKTKGLICVSGRVKHEELEMSAIPEKVPEEPNLGGKLSAEAFLQQLSSSSKIYDGFRQQVIAAARAKMRGYSDEDAAAVISEVITEILETHPTKPFPSLFEFTSYICAAVRKRALNFVKSHRTRAAFQNRMRNGYRNTPENEGADQQDSNRAQRAANDFLSVSDTGSTRPDDLVGDTESIKALKELLSGFDEPQNEYHVLYLRFWREMPLEAIARQLAMGHAESVRREIDRCISRLSKNLK
jgi:RNA polymerase sigma factor (sigma-70 family)